MRTDAKTETTAERKIISEKESGEPSFAMAGAVPLYFLQEKILMLPPIRMTGDKK